VVELPCENWANAYLHSQYEKIGTVDINQPTDYVWGDAAEAYQPRSRSFIDVFRRKQSADLAQPLAEHILKVAGS
jgi:hypothetical protein